MDGADLLKDIEKLVGLELSSIRPGSNLTITEVFPSEKRLEIRTQQGEVRSRPFSEIELLWEKLQTEPAVHVDGALHGSGTSRNQPETILANLPYIEWLKIDGKKHLAYIGCASHPFGTIREMNPISAGKVLDAIKMGRVANSAGLLIVSDDIAQANKFLTGHIRCRPVVVQTGLYRYDKKDGNIYLAARDAFDLDCGSYYFSDLAVQGDYSSVQIDGVWYYAIDFEEVHFLSRKEEDYR